MGEQTGTMAAIYTRQSHAKQASMREQEAAGRAVCAEAGWSLRDVYSDGTSASRFAKGPRPDWDRLRADLTAGAFDVLVLWESSRGDRELSSWVELVSYCREHDIRVHVIADERTYRPGRSAADWKSLVDAGSDSAYESEKTSMRMRRAKAAGALEGRPSGAAPYGYFRRYDPQTRELVEQVAHPDEAPVVRELFRRLRRGHSFRAIARDFEAAGIRTRGQGDREPKPFSPPHLRSLALNEAYAGRLVHRNGTTHVYKGCWEPIVPPVMFDAVARMLADPSRRTNRHGRAVNLLSMIARCGVCDGPLTPARRNGRRHYRCRDRGCVVVDAGELDTLAERVAVRYLARPEIAQALTPDTGESAELVTVRADLEAARRDLDELYDAVASGEVSTKALARIEPQKQRRIDELERRERELATPSILSGLIEPGPDVAERWASTPELSTRRAVIARIATPDHLGVVTVQRVGKTGRRRRPVAERVHWHTTNCLDCPLVVSS